MALSLSNFLYGGILLLPFGLLSHAKTVTYDWNITWTYGNPDGELVRPVIGINNQWPLPHLVADKGDNVIVNVNNQLGNQSTSIHFHGLFMNGTNHMDGPDSVTQCGIPPGGSMTYNFTIEQPGTYWYHSHVRGQYPDGLRGPLIVNDPDSPFKDDYDEEIVLTFSDWYHDQMPGLLDWFISYSNPTGAEPVPQNALVNDTRDQKISVEPGKTYLFRMVNMGAFAAQYVWFEDHTMQIVEVDGVYTQPSEADMLYMTAAQRYSVLITMKNDTSSNFAFVGSMDQDLFDKIPAGLNPNVTGWLVYDEDASLPTPALIDAFDPFDDFTLTPQDGEEIFENVDYSFTLDLAMNNLGDGANYAMFNDITYVHPKVPTLYTALTTGDSATNPAIYGGNTNAYVLNKGDVVELVLNNNDPGKHPFHLHGHTFQVVVRSEDDAGFYNNSASMPDTPMKRDTVLVRPNGNLVLRFRADNPGIWLFHCHIEWHVASGLVATMIEAPLELQAQLAGKIPADHLQICKDIGTPTEGNAAGNTVDFLDLKGENKAPAPLPAGFTARGIVALVFSVISAFLGLVVIAWYGWLPIEPGKQKAVVHAMGVK